MLERALDMWRGEPFRELENLDWAQAEITRLRLDRLEALEERWLVEMDAPAPAQRVMDTSDEAVVGFGYRSAAFVLPSGEVELVHLDTGVRSAVDPDDRVSGFEPIVASP